MFVCFLGFFLCVYTWIKFLICDVTFSECDIQFLSMISYFFFFNMTSYFLKYDILFSECDNLFFHHDILSSFTASHGCSAVWCVLPWDKYFLRLFSPLLMYWIPFFTPGFTGRHQKLDIDPSPCVFQVRRSTLLTSQNIISAKGPYLLIHFWMHCTVFYSPWSWASKIILHGLYMHILMCHRMCSLGRDILQYRLSICDAQIC